MTREEVWHALFNAHGDRAVAAMTLGRSVRTVNRYIKDYDLYPELDENKFIRNQGPPRYGLPPARIAMIILHIHMNDGKINIAELAMEIYGAVNDVTTNRVYTALHEMRTKGVIGVDRGKWFVI